VPDAAAARNAIVSAAREKLTPPPTLSEIAPFERVNLVVAEVEPLPPAQRPCYV